MASHSSMLAWEIQRTEEPSGHSCCGDRVAKSQSQASTARDQDDIGASLLARLVKNLPAMQETQVRLLGQEDLLEKEMATHSGTLAWRIPGTEEPGGLPSTGSHRVGHNLATKPPPLDDIVILVQFFLFFYISSVCFNEV